MKNLLIVLGLMATVSTVSATNMTVAKSENKSTMLAAASQPMAVEIGGEDKDKEKPRP